MTGAPFLAEVEITDATLSRFFATEDDASSLSSVGGESTAVAATSVPLWRSGADRMFAYATYSDDSCQTNIRWRTQSQSTVG